MPKSLVKQLAVLSVTVFSLTGGMVAFAAEHPAKAAPTGDACPAAHHEAGKKCPGSCPDKVKPACPQGSKQADKSKAAASQTPEKTHPGDPMILLSKLNLSKEQSAKVKALVEQGKTESQALYQQVKEKREALMTYLKADDAIEAKALELNSEIQELKGHLGEMRLKTWFAIREQLTPEQRHSLQEVEIGR
jgi:Spy/CpxP family protein refolding chaperone